MSALNRRVVVFALVAAAVTACGGSQADESTTTTASELPTATVAPEAATSTTVGGEADAAPPLAGTSWTVTRYFSEEFNSVTNLWPDTEITLQFDSDSDLSGNAGCNDFQAGYAVSGPYIADPGLDEEPGQMIEITQLTWTEQACESENLMTQEAEFLDVLPRAAYWRIGEGFTEGEGLLINSTDGLILEASPTG